MTSRARSLQLGDLCLLIAPRSLKHYLLIYGTIMVVATAVMAPRMRAPNFGLLDDGVTIAVSSYILQEFKAGNWGVILRLEGERGRFKPLNFLYYAIPYSISGSSALGFFVVQWLSLVLTGIVIYRAVEVVTTDRMAAVLGSVFYIISPPVIENYYTLSKSEPPMVLWITLSLFLLWKSADIFISNRNFGNVLLMASAFSLSIAYFTKETAHAMLLVSILWTIVAFYHTQSSQDRRIFETVYKYAMANMIITSIYWGIRFFSGTVNISSGGDSSHYKIITQNLHICMIRHIGWYIRDFSYLLPILLFIAGLMFTSQWNKLSSRNLTIVGSVLWIVGWTVIMLPWHSTLEYYLLPAAIGVSVIAGVGVSAIVRCLWTSSNVIRRCVYITLLCIFITGSISLANGVTNGRVQIAVDSANTDLIDYLARNIPTNGTLLVNLPEPNEYVFEMGLHLAILRQRQDVQVRYLNSLNLSAASGAFVVTPIMTNQLYPSVRIAVHEGGVKIWKSELHATLGDRAALVYQNIKAVRLFTVAVEKMICPLLMQANVQDGVYCGVKKPAIDRRIFRYGWEVYGI